MIQKTIKFLIVLALFTIIPYSIGAYVNYSYVNHWAIITLIGLLVESVALMILLVFIIVLMELNII